MIGPNTTFVRETLALIKKYIGNASSHAEPMKNFIKDYKDNIINLVGGNIPGGRIYSGELENHASYINNWLSALKDDKKYFFKAASLANKASEFLMMDKAAKVV
jgi:hypothetical protein